MQLFFFIQTYVNRPVARQKMSPRSSSLGRKAGGAFAKAPFWQFRSHLATELIT